MPSRFLRLLSVLLVTGWVLFSACEKEVKIKMSAGESSIVVDGFIETGLPPIVTLTRSFSYFSKVDLSVLDNAFVRGATVKVSDGTREITLREYALDSGGSVANYIIYTIDTTDLAALSFIGEPEKMYRLTIESGGKTYTANTKIPGVSPIDSIWYRVPDPAVDGIPDAREVFIRYTDPDTLGNRLRYFTSRNGGPFLASGNSVYDDAVINGTTFNIGVAPGIDRSREVSFDSSFYFFRGDSLVMKWAAIDKGVYDFWNTLEFSLGAVGNPFASPISVTSNISNGGLGIWAGYNTSYIDLKIDQ